MEQERISMNHYVPLTSKEKVTRLQNKLHEINEIREPMIDRKREIEKELGEIKTKLASKILEDSDYSNIMEVRHKYTKEKYSIEETIRGLNKESAKLNREIDELKMTSDRSNRNDLRKELTSLRDKYMSFSSDTTRVSSTRIMASKFAEELQELISSLK